MGGWVTTNHTDGEIQTMAVIIGYFQFSLFWKLQCVGVLSHSSLLMCYYHCRSKYSYNYLSETKFVLMYEFTFLNYQ